MTKQYKIGTKTFFKDNEITITSAPYELHGVMWQDGVDETGKTFTVKPPGQRTIDAKIAQAEWEKQQTGFKRLKELQRGE